MDMMSYDHNAVLLHAVAAVRSLIASGHFGYSHPAYEMVKTELDRAEEFGINSVTVAEARWLVEELEPGSAGADIR